MNTQTVSTYERYLALDIHKHYLVAGGVNAQQQIVLPPRRFDPSTALRTGFDYAQGRLLASGRCGARKTCAPLTRSSSKRPPTPGRSTIRSRRAWGAAWSRTQVSSR
jgi:hypothetical protein